MRVARARGAERDSVVLHEVEEVVMSIGHIAALVLEGLLGLFIAYAAYTLFAWTPPSITKARDALQYPRWWWVLAGVMATIGAAGLLVGLGAPEAGALAALWGCAYFAVAGLSHLVRGDVRGFTYPLTFLILCVILMALRWTDLAPVLALVGLK